MNINTVNDAWIAKGQAVEDLDSQITKALLDDSVGEDAIKDLKQKRDTTATRRDELKNQLDNLRQNEASNMGRNKTEPVHTGIGGDKKNTLVKNVRGMLRGNPEIVNLATSKDDDGNNFGLTIPVDNQTQINALKRQYDSLEPYVNVESVSTTSGTRVYEQWSDVTPLTNLDDETAEIGDNDDPVLRQIKYNIHRYTGISTLTNSLLKDTDANLLSWINQWIAKKTVVTRNLKIIEAFNAMPSKPTLTSFDDIIDLINLGVDPAINTTSLLMTNTSGFNILSKIKDATGRYLIQPDPTATDKYLIRGKRIVVIGDRWLPNGGTKATPNYPLLFGDPKQAVTLFDLESMSLLSTNIGAGAYEHDTNKIRVIDRFDVQPTDTEAFVAGSFNKIADQPAMIAVNGGSDTASNA